MATTRTIQMAGQTTGTGQITATLNGNTVFSGTVPATPDILFTFDVDMSLAGSIPMSLTIEGCDVYMSGILANYCSQLQESPTPTTEPPIYISSGPTGFLDTDPGVDSRANVTCTGAAYCSPPPPDPRPEGASGTWGWTVNTKPDTPAVFSYDLQIVAGLE